ncbi:hypothetical protein CPB83DRAFT_853816 [Crepidotus variabilis]|uniref:BBC1/AIM3 cysteine proteinase-fold domain-containing protein n=1 Tax=Crepidotus variabilis TaxID=179855 RepID=A0A9P6EFY2_9AGAR|nr:hypothetical protein CPB83DRAFT_853816 [Crepidotus variabilis]
MYTSSWSTRGPNKSVNIGVLFSDLSVFWGIVDFLTSNPEYPTNRKAIYLPPPQTCNQATLTEAHETYSESIALFAESFLGSGQHCGRGECWDLANEALNYFKDYDYIPKPVPSISRTHGHLIYEGRATEMGKTLEGRWRGGDNRVRRGDIAEWRKVRIGRPGGFSMLGDPDHTAIIVADMVPRVTPRDGMSLSPAELGILTVIEQSRGQLPERRDYDCSCLEAGEMWIYRPISMEGYLGISQLSATAPYGHAGLREL